MAAQAICLEEMTQQSIPAAAIYHHGSRQRREVLISTDLRQQVIKTNQTVRRMLENSIAPTPIAERRRYGECSLYDLCQPELIGSGKKLNSLRQSLFIPNEEV